MRLGAYHMVGELYLWREHLCPSCRRERSPGPCHLCGRPVRPKTWEDLNLRPPPWDPLIPEIEALSARVVSERRVILSELREATADLGLTTSEAYCAELVLRAYVGGMAHEDRRRHDKRAAEAANRPRAGRP